MEDKTYYDWLEVSPKASPEVIEKAYKALVIKYHPDLNKEKESQFEEIIKKINEAYDVLSDGSKRSEYDQMLAQKRAQEQERKQAQVRVQSQTQRYYQQVYPQNEVHNQKNNVDYESEIQAAKQQAYRDAYIEDMKNRGYKIRYKKSFKYYIKFIVIILIIFFMIWLIWQIPFVHNWFTNLANKNVVVKVFIDIIKAFYESLYTTFFYF